MTSVPEAAAADIDACPKETTEKDTSPGIVEGDEWVIHLLFDPENSIDGEYHPGKLGVKRLKKHQFSVARPRHSSSDRIRSFIITPKEDGGEYKYVGAIVAQVQAIRDLCDDDENRLVCAYDDPDGDFTEHGLLGFSDHTRPPYWQKNDAAAALGNLSLIFEESGVGLELPECFDLCGEQDG